MPRTLVLIVLTLVFLVPAYAETEADEVQVATSKELKHEQKIFKRDFDTVDIDFKLDALIRYGKCVHKSVVKDLLKILHRDRDPYVQAEAAKALAHQKPFAKEVARGVKPLIETKKTDAKILAALIRTLGTLQYTREWEAISDLISHDEDIVTIACFDVLGQWKELRAWREMQTFWDVYPEGGKWSTGSVSVDTGASGTTDQRAAKAKWKAKYGNKAKQRPRPDCVKALKAAIKQITGEELKKPAEFRRWRKENKQKIKAAERKRD